jgi:hypothetical protein
MSLQWGRRQGVTTTKVAALAVGLAAVALILGAIAAHGVETSTTAELVQGTPLPSTNPELMLVARYASRLATQAQAAQLAANPELKAVRNHALVTVRGAQNSFLAANPELMAAQRYQASKGETVEGIDMPSLEANPELMVFQRLMSAGARE